MINTYHLLDRYYTRTHPPFSKTFILCIASLNTVNRIAFSKIVPLGIDVSIFSL